MEKYAKLFERPLESDVVQTFADFYGVENIWQPKKSLADQVVTERALPSWSPCDLCASSLLPPGT